MKAIDLAWTAGFYEGEGNCNGRKSGNRTTEHVNVTQVNLEPLRRLQKIWGVKIWTNARGVSRWYLCGERARNFMKLILPQLSRRRQAQCRRQFKWTTIR